MRRKCVELTIKERAELERFCSAGVCSVRLVNRAKIILGLDRSGGRAPEKQEALAKCLGASRHTVIKARDAFPALKSAPLFPQRKKREAPPAPQKATGELEARMVVLACGKPPEGCARWTLRLLAAKCVELQHGDSMSRMAISHLLKKRGSSRASKPSGAFRPNRTARS